MKIIAKYVVCFLLVLLSARLFAAVGPPSILCVALDENDDVTITWSIPDDPDGDFTEYLIYYRSGSGQYTVLDNESNYMQDFATIAGSFSGSGSFYMVTSYNGGADTSLPSDTVSPMILSVFSNGGKVNISWNDPGVPLQDSIFRVYRRNAGGAWEPIGETTYPDLDFEDHVEGCEVTVEYKVESLGKGGCYNRSNVASQLVKDTESPLQTNLVCASVDTATGFVKLEWASSKSPDTKGYLVSYFEDFVRTDTIWGADSLTTTFVSNGINGMVRTETLSVAPFDSCFDSATQWYNQAADSLRFKTVFIDTTEFDRCAGKVALQWNMPKGKFPVGVRNLSGFRVYRGKDSEAAQLHATLSSQDSVFVDSGLVTGSVYTYVVAAFDNVLGKEALSNSFRLKIAPPDVPDHLYISSIVNDHSTGNNVVNVYTDSTALNITYGLHRALGATDKFQLVLKGVTTDRSEFSMADESGAAGQTDYHYQVVAFDVCDDIVATSQVAKSIFIDGRKIEQDFINVLNWTTYEGYDTAGSSVANYALVRRINDSRNEDIFNTSNDFDYRDDIVELQYVDGSVCYYVEALEGTGNVYGYVATSRSNLLCLDYSPRVFVPNAFSPDGDLLNDQFLPDVNFIDPTDYRLTIYDRSGSMIYQSADPRQGWNGQGESIGTYVYHLLMRNARGERIELTGKVHLIR